MLRVVGLGGRERKFVSAADNKQNFDEEGNFNGQQDQSSCHEGLFILENFASNPT